MTDSVSRRDWLKTVGAVGAGALVSRDGFDAVQPVGVPVPPSMHAAPPPGDIIDLTSTSEIFIHEASELRDKFRLPLLGVVSLVLTNEDRRRERMDRVRFLAASGSLVGLFVVGLTAMSILATR